MSSYTIVELETLARLRGLAPPENTTEDPDYQPSCLHEVTDLLYGESPSVTTTTTPTPLFSGKLSFRANPNYYDYLSVVSLDCDRQTYKVMYGDNQAMRLSEKGTFHITPADVEGKQTLVCHLTHTERLFRDENDEKWKAEKEPFRTLEYSFRIETGEWLNLSEYGRQLPGFLFTTRLMFNEDPCRMNYDSGAIAYYLQNGAIEIQSWEERPDLINKVILSKWETCDTNGKVLQVAQDQRNADEEDSLDNEE